MDDSGPVRELGDLFLRPADEADLTVVAELARHPEVEPFLAPGVGEEDRLRELWAQGGSEEGPGGLYVIELAGEGMVGALGFRVVSPRSRLCEITRLMVDPAVRRRGVGVRSVRLACGLAFEEHRFHRVQAETYGDNEAGQRLFTAAGFTREGIRRKAYWRRERWLDGVLYGIVAEESSGESTGPVQPST